MRILKNVIKKKQGPYLFCLSIKNPISIADSNI